MEEYCTKLSTAEVDQELVNYYLLLSQINQKKIDIKTIITSLSNYVEKYNKMEYISSLLDNIIITYGINEWDDIIITLIEKKKENVCFKLQLENYFPSVLVSDQLVEFFKNRILIQLDTYINSTIVINGLQFCPLYYFDRINHKDPQFFEIFNKTSQFLLFNPTLSNMVSEHAKAFTNFQLNERIVRVGFIYQKYSENSIFESEGFQV